jgi:hypothetical protein
MVNGVCRMLDIIAFKKDLSFFIRNFTFVIEENSISSFLFFQL